MNILHLHTNLNLTCGITRTIFLITKKLTKDCNHFVFTLGGDAINKFDIAGINVYDFHKSKRGLLQTIEIFLKILFLLRKQNIDIIHSHHRYFDFIAFIISRFVSVKTITSVQSKVYGKIFLSYKADCLIACSNSIKDHLIDYFRINSDRITVIHNFVDPRDAVIKIEKSALRRELGIDVNSIVIGFIGRFSLREKGVDILLASFKKLSFENNRVMLLLIGDGEDIKFMNDFIKKYNLKALVLPSKENIYDYYNVIDIVALPSRIEPFGIVAIEAGLMKKPLVASNVDGLEEIIDSGLNGVLFPNENVDLLTENLNALIMNSGLRMKFGEELYKKVMNKFTSEKIIPIYKQTYQQLMLVER